MDIAKAVEPVVTPTPVVTTGCEQYRPEVSKYDWDIQIMMAIMQAESGCTPTSVGDNYPINGLLAPSCGLFQIRTLNGRPDCDQLKDPQVNIEWAHKIYSGQGLKAWSVYTNGKFKEFIK